MILIGGTSKITFEEGMLSELELSIYQKKQNSPIEYRYDSVYTLLFELYMRSQIAESAKELSKAGVYFADFKKTLCNPMYWHLTNQGRFQLNSGCVPQDAIRDIFTNGSSYAFECSMAVVVVLYKALLESIDPRQFDILFADLLLFDWHSNSKFTKSAFLADRYVHPDFSYFTEFQHRLREKPIIAKVGDWINVRKSWVFNRIC
ncbi:hypothetical protein AB4Z22_14565 [Paenibacillus sp. TAF58]